MPLPAASTLVQGGTSPETLTTADELPDASEIELDPEGNETTSKPARLQSLGPAPVRRARPIGTVHNGFTKLR